MGFRRRRHYKSQNLDKLLRTEGVYTSWLMPKDQADGVGAVKLNADRNNPAPFPAFLPLEIFDNAEYDIRTTDEWLEMGLVDGVRMPVPAKALLPTRDDCHQCRLLVLL